MMNFGPTFFWTAVNLLVLYIALRKILFKRVTEYMQKRSDSIRDMIDSANKSREDAEKLKLQYEGQLKSAGEEAARIVENARTIAEKEREEIIKAAKQEADTIIERARLEMERERDRMMKEIKGQIAGLALAAASKVIEANMDTERNRALVDKFIDEAGAA